jgi:hypothetical protein
MTLIRAALYLGLAAVSGVWLSSVVSSMAQRDHEVTVAEAPQEANGLAAEVQEQSQRLRERLAAGPPAPHPLRNPFAFGSATPRARAHPDRLPGRQALEPEPAPAPDLELSLIGIATHQRPDGPVRTAMMSTLEGDLVMATGGDTVLDRFRVIAVGADSVDVVESATGAATRLHLAPR